MKTLIPVASYLSLYLAFLVFCGIAGIAAVAVLARRLDAQPLSMPNLSTALFVYLTTGMGLAVCFLFLIALVGGLKPWAVASTAALALALSLAGLTRLRVDLHRALGLGSSGSRDWIWIAPLWIYSAGVLMGALRLPFAWDELSYHLPYAREYLQAGGLTVNEFLRYPLHSHNFNLLFSLALMVSDERLTHLIHGGSALLLALGLFGTARHFLGLGAAVVAAAILLSFESFRGIVPTAHVDLGLALFVTLGAFSLVHWHTTGRRFWLYVAAFATGLAMGTKYLGALFAPLFGLWVLVRSRSLRETLAFTFVVTLFGIWWYLRSYLIGGNPVHPFAGDLFGYFLWDAQDLVDQHRDLASHAPAKGLSAPFRAAVDLAFGDPRELSALALPFFLTPFVFRHLTGALRALFAITLAYYLIWAWFLGPARYLMAIMPAMALFSAASAVAGFEALARRPRARPFAVWFGRRQSSLLPLLAILLALVAARETYGVLKRLPTWPWAPEEQVAYMAARNPGFELVRAANASPEIDRRPIYLMGFGNLNYWYEGKVLGDFFGSARYRQIYATDPATGERTPDPGRIGALAERFGVVAVIVERAMFPHLDFRSWSRQFRLIAQNDAGYLWLIDTGAAR